MDTPIIDRRLNGKGKNVGNVDRFQRRFAKQIKEAAERALQRSDGKGIDGVDVTIPHKNINQPVFRHGKGGIWENVHPGNKDYYTGDKIKRPPEDSSSRKTDSGEVGEDDFIFHLDKRAVFHVLLEGLKLPDMIKRFLLDEVNYRFHRAGIVKNGNPSNLHVLRSFRSAVGRRIALDSAKKKRLSMLSEALNLAATSNEFLMLQNEIERARAFSPAPFMDPIDMRFRNSVKVPIPQSKAVFFRLMDASGSMSEEKKSDAKLFNILLKLFLEREYEHVEIVNIRYHWTAYECDDQTFYFGTDTGGTNVSNSLDLMIKIIQDRYPINEWNIYGSLSSDGDTGTRKDEERIKEVFPTLLDMCQYFVYLEIADMDKELGD